jgi:hypothetical protein
MKWQEGRQGSGYQKLKLFESKWLKCDVYLLKFPTGSAIDYHYDQVKGYQHSRINVILKKAKKGGKFYIEGLAGYPRFIKSRVVWFRPDIDYHGVTPIEEGTRYVLSIGWLF